MSRTPGTSNALPRKTPRPAAAFVDRLHSRFGVSLPVRCTRLTGRSPRAWPGRTANVSGGGLAVDLPIRLPPHTHVAIQIRTGVGPLRMEADVLWTRRVAGKDDVTRHGLCLPDRSGIMDLPIYALLGEWLQGLARREAKEMGRKGVRVAVRTHRAIHR